MPASIRIIRILKDPVTQEDTYTVEFECEAEKSSELIKELSACPTGKQVIDLLNRAQFLPAEEIKTPEDMKEEAEVEEATIKKHDEEITQYGINKGRRLERIRCAKYIRNVLKVNITASELKKHTDKEEVTEGDAD